MYTYELTEELEKSMWHNAIFIFDTSALLDLYFYSDSTQEQFVTLFEKLKGRLWLPYQVIEEYERHRKEKITAPKVRYDQLIKKNDSNKDSGYITKIEDNLNQITGLLKTLGEETKKADKHPYIESNVIEDFQTKILQQKEDFNLFKESFQSEIDKQKDKLDKKVTNDKILSLIDEHFKKGVDYSFEESFQIAQEGEIRYRLEIPPGYMDDQGRNKKDGLSKFGDLFIWKQILDFAEIEQKPMILIINDVKEDWCIVSNSDKNEIESPRKELIKEFKFRAKSDIWLYTMKQFLYKSKNYLNSKISQESIDEVTEIMSNSNSVKEFNEIFGLKKGDKINDAYDILGSPDEFREHPEYSFNSVYYKLNGRIVITLSYNKSDNAILAIIIKEQISEFLKKINLNEEKIRFIGQHANSITDVFGKPEISSDNYEFRHEKTKLSFQCYQSRDYLCSSLTIYWFR